MDRSFLPAVGAGFPSPADYVEFIELLILFPLVFKMSFALNSGVL